MNFLALMGLLPTILQAVELAQKIHSDVRGDKSIGGIVSTIQNNSPQVLDIFQKVGGTLFPNLGQQQQVAAAAVTFDPELVKKIQEQLNKLGAKLDADGHYGPKTKEAVKAFQGANGLEVDGWAGKNTQAKLNEKAGA